MSYSPSCRSKPIRTLFFFGTQIKIFLMKYKSFLNLHRILFFFFVHANYSRRFVKLWLNYWCHMDYFTNVLTTFLGLGIFQLHCFLWRVTELSDFIKNLNLCSEDEQRSYGFGMTWGWVIKDRIFIFGWTIPLNIVGSIFFFKVPLSIILLISSTFY